MKIAKTHCIFIAVVTSLSVTAFVIYIVTLCLSASKFDKMFGITLLNNIPTFL